jgi:hypothetical protein
LVDKDYNAPVKSPLKSNKNTRVFISTTYEELLDVRSLMIIGVTDSKYTHVDAHEHGLHDITVDYLKRLICSSDIFIGFLGFRYGSLIDCDDKDSISYVEYEYSTAVDNNYGMNGKPIYVFLPEQGSKFERHLYVASQRFFQGDNEKMKEDFERQEKFKESLMYHIPVEDQRYSSVSDEDRKKRSYHRILKKFASLDSIRAEILQLLVISVPEFFETQRRANEQVASSPATSSKKSKDRESRSVLAYQKQLDLIFNYQKQWLEFCNNNTPPAAICLLLQGACKDTHAGMIRNIHYENFLDVENPESRYKFKNEMPRQTIDDLCQFVYCAIEDSLDSGQSYSDIDLLAKSIFEHGAAVMLSIRQVNLMEGQIRVFVNDFWKPLCHALNRYRSSYQCHPDDLETVLYLIVTYEKPRMPKITNLIEDKPSKLKDFEKIFFVKDINKNMM